MDIRKLQRAIVDGLEDVKAHNIVVFNTEHLSPLFERVIIASGTSNRQTKALASSVRESVKSKGLATPRTEGEENGEWIIVDCGAAVVHLMQPAIRDYYHLEELWGEKSVKMKFDGASTKLVKASEAPVAQPTPANGRRGAAGKSPATKTTRGGAVAKKAPARQSAAKPPTSRKTAAKKAPASRAPAAPKTVARQVVAKKATRRA